MKKLLVLLVLVVAADFLGALLAERALAAQVRRSAGASSASVDVRGFPFLTQAVRGRYASVGVSASGLPDVAALRVTLRDVEVPLSSAVRGSVSAVPVSGVSGAAVLPFSRVAPRGVQLAARDGRLAVTGTVQVLGQSLSATAIGRLEVRGSRVVAVPERYEVPGQTLSDALTRVLAERLKFSTRLPALPYGLRVSNVGVSSEGLVVSASSGPTVLQPTLRPAS